ncbi:MAG: response regulator [Deltaproteobacteria bacterium]|nr:response regulator [Deltaproteobacteria bacterium]
MSEHALLKDKRILVVDDEPDVLGTIEDLLDDCTVETAGSFEEARKLMETRPFDLAILDIMGVAGYDLLKIATRKKIIPVMLTAHALCPENVVRSYREGAAYYVPKEEMVNIASFLEDILDAREKGQNTWARWFDRLGAFCERRFGPDWQKGDQVFWEKFPFH